MTAVRLVVRHHIPIRDIVVVLVVTCAAGALVRMFAVIMTMSGVIMGPLVMLPLMSVMIIYGRTAEGPVSMPPIEPGWHHVLRVLSARRHAMPAHHPHTSSATKRHASRAEAAPHAMPHMRMVRPPMVGSGHGRERRMPEGKGWGGQVSVQLPRVRVWWHSSSRRCRWTTVVSVVLSLGMVRVGMRARCVMVACRTIMWVGMAGMAKRRNTKRRRDAVSR